MSHRDDCPDRWEARREGYRAGERGYGSNPYRSDYDSEGCPEAAREFESGRHSAEYDREEQQREEWQAQMAARRAQETDDEQGYAYYEQQYPPEHFPEEPMPVDGKLKDAAFEEVVNGNGV